jgi:hypothetical protein
MLEPDQPRTGQALGTLYTITMTVNKYVMDLTGASFAPATFLGTSVDMMASFPKLKANLIQAQNHVQDWTPISQTLGGGFIKLYEFNGSFKSSADEISQTLDAAKNNADGQPTQDQKQTISSRLQDLRDRLTSQREDIKQQKGQLKSFYDQVAAQAALDEALFVWQTVEGKYNSVIDDLNSADKSDRAFAELIHINAAEAAWDQLTNYCEQVVINNLKNTG